MKITFDKFRTPGIYRLAVGVINLPIRVQLDEAGSLVEVAGQKIDIELKVWNWVFVLGIWDKEAATNLASVMKQLEGCVDD